MPLLWPQSLLTASFATAMSWQGRIVARLVPKTLPIKPQKACLEAHNLQALTGPRHAPIRPRPATPPMIDISNDDLEAVLDVYLLEEDLVLHFHRSLDESFQSTLDRLALSIHKKRQKQHNNKTLEPPLLTLWQLKLDSEQSSVALAADSLTNAGLCQARTPLALQLKDATGSTQRLLLETSPPMIISVQVFEDFDCCLFPGIPVVVNVETLFADGCRVDWYVGNRLVGQASAAYVPNEDDIDQTLSVLLTPFSSLHDGRGCEEAYRFARPIQPCPASTMLRLRPKWTAKRASSETALRVMTWNVLADQNAYSKTNQMPFYPYVASETLERARRMPLVLQEILAYHADVICLQEVDELVFESLFEPTLDHFGYDGTFACKSQSGMREGCALFWRRDRLETCKSEMIAYQDVLPFQTDYEGEWMGLRTIDELFRRHPDLHHDMSTKLGHVVQLVTLKDRTTGRRVLVANTHLFFHPRASHIRLIQMYLLAYQMSCRLDRKTAAIVCGDFNSSLQDAAGKLLLERHVPANFRDLQTHLHSFVFGKDKAEPGGNKDDDFPSLSLAPSFPSLMSGLSETPAFTHFIDGFVGSLDHILCSSDDFCSRSSAPMPTAQEASAHVAMPSELLPSDHVSLVCDLEWRR